MFWREKLSGTIQGTNIPSSRPINFFKSVLPQVVKNLLPYVANRCPGQTGSH